MKVLIERLAGRILGPLDGWKSIIGVLAAAALMTALHLGWIDESMFDRLYPYCGYIFGVGIIHKAFKHDRGTGSMPVR